jgi:hypothetical protein
MGSGSRRRDPDPIQISGGPDQISGPMWPSGITNPTRYLVKCQPDFSRKSSLTVDSRKACPEKDVGRAKVKSGKCSADAPLLAETRGINSNALEKILHAFSARNTIRRRRERRVVFLARRPGTAMKVPYTCPAGPIHPLLLRFRPCGDSAVGPAPTVSTRPEAPVVVLRAEKMQDHFSSYYLKDATGGDGCI